MTVKSESGARAEGTTPDPKTLVKDDDVSTSPGIGPGEGASADPPLMIDEAAKTTPFARPEEGTSKEGPSSSVSVDLDGGWSIETEKMPAQAAPEPTPEAAAAPETPLPAPVPVPEPKSGSTTLTGPGTPPELASATPPASPETPAPAPAPAPASVPAAAPAPEPAAEEAPKSAEPEAPAEPVAAAKAEPVKAATPGGPIDVNVFGRTDVGLVREHNEDNFLIADLTTGNRSLLPEVREHAVGKRGSLLVVCDGMGGAAAGEVASLLAVDTIYELLQGIEVPRNGVDLARAMVDAIEEAGRRIFAAARLDRTRRGMGTTVTGACVLDGTLYLAQVGDSRGYVVRGTQIEQVTKDQSLVNQLIEAGQLTEEEAEAFEHSNIILQALGTAAEVSVDVTHVPLRRGDILVVCSDGLSGTVTSDQMKEVVLSTPEPIEACKRLTEMANAAGGHDNITVIVARFDGDGLMAAQPDDRLSFQRVTLPPGPRSSQPPQAVATDAAAPQPLYRPTEPDIDGPIVPDEAQEPPPSARGGMTIFLLLLAVIVGAAVAYVVFSGILTASAPAGASSVPSAVASSLPPHVPAQAPLAPAGPAVASAVGASSMPIVSNALASATFRFAAENGRLRVDGLDRGPLERGVLTLQLPVGPHDVSVTVDGTTVVSRNVTVATDGPNDFGLEGPVAVQEEAPAPLAPVAPVPAGVSPSAPAPLLSPAAPPNAGPRVARPPAPPAGEPGKSPQRLVPPRPAGGDVQGQQF